MENDFSALLQALEAWGAEPAQALEDSFGGEEEFYRTCLNKFAQENFLQTLREALARGDLQPAILAVHTMKGNADYLGLFPVMDTALAVLSDLRDHRLELAMTDIPKLEKCFLEFQTLLETKS